MHTSSSWTTKAGLPASTHLHMAHWNGYVQVPQGCVLHGLDHQKAIPELIPLCREDIPVGKRGLILALTTQCNALPNTTIRSSPDIAFDVHGGITYSGPMPPERLHGTWCFGFDTNHWGDSPDTCTEEYVKAECESLAEQIAAFLATQHQLCQTNQNNKISTLTANV